MNKVHILNKHHDNKTTVVVGEFCINDCQIFHKNNANEVFKEFDVSEQHQKEVMDLFDNYNPTELFDVGMLNNIRDVLMTRNELGLYDKIVNLLIEHYYTKELRDFLFNHDDDNVKSLGIKYFTTEQKTQLLTSKKVFIRELLAIYGESKHLDVLVNDVCDIVRFAVAERGFDNFPTKIISGDIVDFDTFTIDNVKIYLDKLLHDQSALVRTVVAEVGYKDHLDVLVDDPSIWVRRAVAIQKHKEHLDKLMYDKSSEVRLAVAAWGNKEHLDILVHDVDVNTCLATIFNKNVKKEHLKVLVDHNSGVVRSYAKDALKRLENDE